MAHRQTFKEDYEFEVIKTPLTINGKECFSYSVSLPHQCDNWEIIGAESGDDSIEHGSGPNWTNCPLSKEFSVNQMELFVKRANEALEKLRNI